MGNRISRAAIDTLKGKIKRKLALAKAQLPSIDKTEIQSKVLKQFGLAQLAKEWEALQAKRKKLSEEAEKLVEKLKKIYPNARNAYSSETIIGALSGSYNSKSQFEVELDKATAIELNKTAEGQEVQRLEKLLGDVDLTLELATSTAEVKEALKEILRQIGE